MPFGRNQSAGPFTKEIGRILKQTYSATRGVEPIEKEWDQTGDFKLTYAQSTTFAVASHTGSGSTTRTPYAAR
jgi:hypothetical protein